MTKMVQMSVVITLFGVILVIGYTIKLIKSISDEIPSVHIALVAIPAIETDTRRTEQEMSGLLNTTRQIMVQERDSQKTQLADIQRIDNNAVALLQDADVATRQFAVSMKQLGDVAPVLSGAIEDVRGDVHGTLTGSQSLMVAATQDLNNPDIQKALFHVNESSGNVAIATQNLADTTKDIKDYVHLETTPVRGTWNFIKGLIDLTWSVRGAIGF